MNFELPINPSGDLSTNYFRVSIEGVFCDESDMSDFFIKTPDIFAFRPYFKNAYYINPTTKSDVEPDGSPQKPFKSLIEAISKTNKTSNFIVNQHREDVISSQNISNDVNVFYEDDLSFLKGKIDLSILSGIDEDAEIELFFLCKIFEFEKLEISMRLYGFPEIIFEERKSKFENRSNPITDNKNKSDEKVLLTPKIVKTYLGYKTIYLSWEIPENDQYRGVRIFRSEKRDHLDLENLGDEIYDGPGSFSERLYCTCRQRKSIRQDYPIPISMNIKPENLLPPERKGFPNRASFGEIYIGKNFEVRSPFFEDKNVIAGDVYTYTLYAFDINNKYSYPILINASLSEWSPEHSCMRSVR